MHNSTTHLLLQGVDLLIGQVPVHATISDSVAVAREASLGIRKVVDELHVLHEIASHLSHQCKEGIFMKLWTQPECNVLVVSE